MTLHRRLSAGLVAAMSIAIIGGCSQNAPNHTGEAAEPTTLATTLPSDEGYIYGLSVTKGVITVKNGCLALSRSDNDIVTLVYPAEYSLIEGRSGLAVADNAGQQLYAVGQQVQVGGAPLADEPASRLMSQSVRDTCAPPYYMVRPRPSHESDR